MKRCKYVNEQTVRWEKNPVFEEGRVYCNPSAEMLRMLGYFPFIDSAKGEEMEGFVQVARYRVEKSAICRYWIYVENQVSV